MLFVNSFNVIFLLSVLLTGGIVGVAGQFRGWPFAAYAVYPIILFMHKPEQEVTLKLSLCVNVHYPVPRVTLQKIYYQ